MTDLRKIERALISASEKIGIVEFAQGLAEFGVEIISTGGTAKTLRDNGLQVTDVSRITDFPEMMDGRVKTLHPKIHGAFLALRDNDDHLASMQEHGIRPIDLVAVNLYPFEKTVAKEGVTLEEAVENIDIGGPAMIRSAAKNWRDVAVITDTGAYAEVLGEMRETEGCLSLSTRRRLATQAYTRTATYDLAISRYLKRQHEVETHSMASGGTQSVSFGIERVSVKTNKELRYGENPHQKASLAQTGQTDGVANGEQLHGKEMSFNNYVDADAAWELVNDFDELAVAIIKHTNPSGIGIGASNAEAYRRALSTDPVSAFGGIVAFNRTVDAEVSAEVIKVFTEVVVAPDFDEDALAIFREKKNLRVLKVGRGNAGGHNGAVKQISGGMLIQDPDTHRLNPGALKLVTERKPTDVEVRSMLLAWNVCKHVKSNAIVIANETQTLGVGAGQMNRVDSVRIAAMRAERFGHPLKGSALASDAFFPFRDNVDEAAKLGVTAIIQPGGSIKDDESIAAANEHGIAMAFTGIRHFKH